MPRPPNTEPKYKCPKNESTKIRGQAILPSYTEGPMSTEALFFVIQSLVGPQWIFHCDSPQTSRRPMWQFSFAAAGFTLAACHLARVNPPFPASAMGLFTAIYFQWKRLGVARSCCLRPDLRFWTRSWEGFCVISLVAVNPQVPSVDPQLPQIDSDCARVDTQTLVLLKSFAQREGGTGCHPCLTPRFDSPELQRHQG